jgi:hypothetical protein
MDRALGRWSQVAADSQSPMRLGVIFRFLVTTFSAHALRTGAHLHAVCMHIFPQNGAISCKIMQNRMIASRTGIFTYTFVAKQLGCRTRLRSAIGRRFREP